MQDNTDQAGASPRTSSWADTPEHRASVAYWAGRRKNDYEDFTAEAMLCAFAHEAGHWPTVAGYLADEVERLRAIEAAARQLLDGTGIGDVLGQAVEVQALRAALDAR